MGKKFYFVLLCEAKVRERKRQITRLAMLCVLWHTLENV